MTERAAPSEAEALVERRNWPDLSWVATRIGDQLAEQHLEAVQRDLDRLAHEGDTLRAEVERLQEQAKHIEVGYKASLDVYVAAQQRDLKKVTRRLDLAMRVVEAARALFRKGITVHQGEPIMSKEVLWQGDSPFDAARAALAALDAGTTPPEDDRDDVGLPARQRLAGNVGHDGADLTDERSTE